MQGALLSTVHLNNHTMVSDKESSGTDFTIDSVHAKVKHLIVYGNSTQDSYAVGSYIGNARNFSSRNVYSGSELHLGMLPSVSDVKRYSNTLYVEDCYNARIPLTGTYPISVLSENEMYIRFSIGVLSDIYKIISTHGVCNYLPWVGDITESLYEAVSFDVSTNAVLLQLRKDRLTTYGMSEGKETTYIKSCKKYLLSLNSKKKPLIVYVHTQRATQSEQYLAFGVLYSDNIYQFYAQSISFLLNPYTQFNVYTGEVTNQSNYIVLDGNAVKISSVRNFNGYVSPVITLPSLVSNATGTDVLCSHGSSISFEQGSANSSFGVFVNSGYAYLTDKSLSKTYTTATQWNNYFKSQYDAGTPVMMVYKTSGSVKTEIDSMVPYVSYEKEKEYSYDDSINMLRIRTDGTIKYDSKNQLIDLSDTSITLVKDVDGEYLLNIETLPRTELNTNVTLEAFSNMRVQYRKVSGETEIELPSNEWRFRTVSSQGSLYMKDSSGNIITVTKLPVLRGLGSNRDEFHIEKVGASYTYYIRRKVSVSLDNYLGTSLITQEEIDEYVLSSEEKEVLKDSYGIPETAYPSTEVYTDVDIRVLPNIVMKYLKIGT